jgi:hypothetical protein
MGAPAVTVEVNPTGSSTSDGSTEGIYIIPKVIQRVASDSLNSLANAGSVSSLSYSNPASVSNVTVSVYLETITPTAGGKVRIESGSTAYEHTLATTTAVKRAVFYNIPAAFTTSFSFINNSGVALADSGNYIEVLPAT